MTEVTQIINVQITRILKGEDAEQYLKFSKDDVENAFAEDYKKVADCDDVNVHIQNFVMEDK